MGSLLKRNKMELELRDYGIDENGVQVEHLNIQLQLQGRMSKHSMSCIMGDIADAIVGKIIEEEAGSQFSGLPINFQR